MYIFQVGIHFILCLVINIFIYVDKMYEPITYSINLEYFIHPSRGNSRQASFKTEALIDGSIKHLRDNIC